MSREIWKAVPLGLGLLAIAMVFCLPSGCSDTNAPQYSATPTEKRTVPPPAAPARPAAAAPTPVAARPVTPAKPEKKVVHIPKPMLSGWAKPAAALVLSGEQHGYMEPCGCSITQSGGLSRRADFFRQLAEKGWPVAALDFGGLVRKDNLQNKLKFQVMIAALKDLGYQALALGKEELALERLELGFLLTQRDGAPPFLTANVEFTQLKGAGVAAPTRIVNVGGRKVGVTAIFGKSLKKELFGNTPDPNIAVKDPEEALPAAIAELKKDQAEILVLLAHAERDEAAALAKKFGEFDLVVTAGPEDGNGTPERIGKKTLLLEIGQKGKHVGVVGFYPENKERPFRFELVDLDKYRFHDTPKMIDRMREYQGMLAQSYDAVMQDLPKSRHPSGDRFAGVETCKDCHKKAYAVWKGSKHAHAYQTLVTGREGAKNVVPRHHDPECIACHTTGWDPQQVFPFESGFFSAAKTPALKDQQCENCHGPAAKHVQLELDWKAGQHAAKESDVKAARDQVKLKLAVVEKTGLCFRCHDLENDPNFNFAAYWEEIKHPGRD